MNTQTRNVCSSGSAGFNRLSEVREAMQKTLYEQKGDTVGSFTQIECSQLFVLSSRTRTDTG
jgi:hypothetical protein